jgi:Protein of unknown function (DUF4238)
MPDAARIPGAFSAWLDELMEGRRSLRSADGSRHHYVPEFVLKHFCCGKRTLFQLDKETGDCNQTTPKEAAWAEDLYAVESVTGEHDGIIEGFFSVAESFSAESLARLLRNPAHFTDDDRGNLAFLAALQELRAPGFLAEFEESLEIQAIVFGVVEMANTTGPARVRRLARESAEALAEGRVIVRPTRENVLTTALLGLAASISPAYHLPWTVLRAKEGEFVTSDRPVTQRDPAPPHRFSGTGWVSSEFAYTTMPLSSTVCLRIGASGRNARFAERDTVTQVGHTNLRTYAWARRHLYASSAKVLEDLHARAQAEPDAVQLPQKKRLVLVEDIENADPANAERNAAKGWDRLLVKREEDGSFRLMSYRVVESVEDARDAAGPRKDRPDGQEYPLELRPGHPPSLASTGV